MEIDAAEEYITPMETQHKLERLKEALEAHRRALEELESALLEFEGAIEGGRPAPGHPNGGRGPELLSIEEVCRGLGMGKSWVYRRVKSGEIPSVKLGRAIKVRAEDLDGYLEEHRHRPLPSIEEADLGEETQNE